MAERCNVVYHSSITFLGMNRNYLTLVKHNPTPLRCGIYVH
nr:MAG TPA: hypothetical protein [Caudoviricetes sp.]